MAEFDFREFTASKEDKGSSSKVKYFNSLVKDGDETLVRFNYDSDKDFKVVSTHRVEDNGRPMVISCLRELYETKADSKCPFCKLGDKYPVKIKTYVQMIEYTRDEDGNVVANPVVWERGAAFIKDLLDAFNEGITDGVFPRTTSLRDVVFKVRRSGDKGSTGTRFHLRVGNPAMYPESLYVKDFTAFDGYDASKHAYWVKSVEDINRFLETGTFKTEEAKEEAAPAPAVETKPAEEVAPKAAPRKINL